MRRRGIYALDEWAGGGLIVGLALCLSASSEASSEEGQTGETSQGDGGGFGDDEGDLILAKVEEVEELGGGCGEFAIASGKGGGQILVGQIFDSGVEGGQITDSEIAEVQFGIIVINRFPNGQLQSRSRPTVISNSFKGFHEPSRSSQIALQTQNVSHLASRVADTHGLRRGVQGVQDIDAVSSELAGWNLIRGNVFPNFGFE